MQVFWQIGYTHTPVSWASTSLTLCGCSCVCLEQDSRGPTFPRQWWISVGLLYLVILKTCFLIVPSSSNASTMNCPKQTHCEHYEHVESTSMTLIQHHANVVCPVRREVKVILLLSRRATTSKYHHLWSCINNTISFPFQIWGSRWSWWNIGLHAQFYIDRAAYITSIILYTLSTFPHQHSMTLDYVVSVLCRRLLILCD